MRLTNSALPGLAVSALILTGCAPSTASFADTDRRLLMTGVGRFALFADLDTLQRNGDQAVIRALQVAEPGFEAGGTVYWGGWSWWAFDCRAATADRLDFASLDAQGREGPATPEPSPPYPVAPGGDAAELMAVACGDADTSLPLHGRLHSAVAAGQAALTD